MVKTLVPKATAADAPSTARLFHALSDETRLEIVRMLRHGERCVCELTDALDAAQSRLSFHLRILKEAGLVTDRREGRWVYYALQASALSRMEKAIGSLKPMPILRSRGDGGGCC
jgi:ArsR family transcriptional regulator